MAVYGGGVGRAVVLPFFTTNYCPAVLTKGMEKYEGQRIMVIDVGDYAYLVPFLETETSIILKTIIPSRKATRQYLQGREE